MPKNHFTINKFDGGISNDTDPRDIGDNEFPYIDKVSIDKVGKIRSMGIFYNHPTINPNPIGVIGGYGLFCYGTDYNKAGSQTSENWVALADSTNSEIDLYDAGTDTWTTGEIILGNDANAKAVFYNVDGGLRVCDADFSNTNNVSKIRTLIDRELFQSTSNPQDMTVSGNGGWKTELQEIQKPGAGRIFVKGSPLSADVPETYLDETADTISYLLDTGYNLNTNAVNANDSDLLLSDATLGFTYSKVKSISITVSAVDVSSEFNADIAFRAGGQTGAGSDGTSFQSTNYKYKLAENCVYNRREDGNNAYFTQKLIFDGDGLDVSVNDLRISARLLTDFGDTIDIVSVFVESSIGTSTMIPYSDGIGIVVGNSAVDSTGEYWVGNWNLGLTYIYDETQESIISELKSDVGLSYILLIKVPYFRICVDYDATGDYWNSRVTGAKLYMKKDGEQTWMLAVTIDFVKGTMKYSIKSSASECTYVSGTLYEFNISDLAEDDTIFVTYESETGFSNLTETSIAKFKTAVVANRRAYIGNLFIEGKSYGDTIIKSFVNRFDTFVLGNKIDVNINDGEQIIKIEEYADRLLEFKERTLYIINISQDVEFLESVHHYRGVAHPAAVAKTEAGIVWANEHGLFLYNGQNVVDLLMPNGIKKISSSYWNSFYTTTTIVGYSPLERKIFVHNSSVGEEEVLIYNLLNFSLEYYSNTTFISLGDKTNFFNDWNGKLIFVYENINNSLYGIFKYWKDDSSAQQNIIIETKDIDFGVPDIKKNLYKILITYTGGTGQSLLLAYKEGNLGSWASIAASATELSDTSGNQVIADIDISTIRNIESVAFRITGNVASTFEINDITIIYRAKGIH